MSNKPTLLSTVPFSSFSQWDVKQFFFAKILSKYPVEELGKHLIHQTEKIQLSDEPTKEFTILGVSNKIGMFDGSTEKGSKINATFEILDENKNIVPLCKEIYNAKFLSDIIFSENDYALNTLLTLLPQRIEIHLLDSEDEFIKTVKLIFEDRVYICRECNICRTYKMIKMTKQQ